MTWHEKPLSVSKNEVQNACFGLFLCAKISFFCTYAKFVVSLRTFCVGIRTIGEDVV